MLFKLSSHFSEGGSWISRNLRGHDFLEPRRSNINQTPVLCLFLERVAPFVTCYGPKNKHFAKVFAQELFENLVWLFLGKNSVVTNVHFSYIIYILKCTTGNPRISFNPRSYWSTLHECTFKILLTTIGDAQWPIEFRVSI